MLRNACSPPPSPLTPPPQVASTASVSPANPSPTDEPRKIASVKRMSALLRSSSAETQGISSTSIPISTDVARGDSKVTCTDNGKPTTPLALSASTASRVMCLTSYVVKQDVVEDSDVKYAKAVLEATSEKIRADKLESQVTELLKRVRTADSDAIKLMSEHDTVILGLHTKLDAKEKQVLELQRQLDAANTALQVATSAAQEQQEQPAPARQERDFLDSNLLRQVNSSEKALDEALPDTAELDHQHGAHDEVEQWMMRLSFMLGITLGVYVGLFRY